VMARSLGFPARVVVGYRLIEADDAGEVVLVDEVTSQDLHAWAEVKLDGLGWVPFDPTPLTVGEAAEEPEEAPQGPGTTIAEGEVVGEQPGQAPGESGPTERESPDEPEGFARILALVAAIAASVVLLVLLAAMAVLSAKRRRRRRRATAP